MKKGTLSNGFQFCVDETVLNDYGTLVILRKLDDNAGYVVDLIDKLFSDDEQRDKFLESCKDDNGRIPADKLMELVEELFEAMGADAKN